MLFVVSRPECFHKSEERTCQKRKEDVSGEEGGRVEYALAKVYAFYIMQFYRCSEVKSVYDDIQCL